MKTVYKVEKQISKIAIHGEDLFVDVFHEPEIKVYDITTYKYKYSLRAASGNEGCWDVHKDFVLIFDGMKLYIWDRHTNQEVEVPNDAETEMQPGYHCKLRDSATKLDDNEPNDTRDSNVEEESEEYDERILFMNKIFKPDKDFPVHIKIFPDSHRTWDYKENGILIAYKSGIVIRWSFKTPYQEYIDDFGKKEEVVKFEFTAEMRSNYLSRIDKSRCRLNGNEIQFQHTHANGDRPWEKYSKILYTDSSDAYYIDLEYGEKYAIKQTIDGVDQVLFFYESDTLRADDYDGVECILLLRSMDTVQEQEKMQRAFYKATFRDGSYKEWCKKRDVQYKDSLIDDLSYFEIHMQGEGEGDFIAVRRMKIHGVQGACMNDEHVCISVQSSGIFPDNCINIYNSQEMVNDEDFCEDEDNNAQYVPDPLPIRTIQLGRGNTPQYLTLYGPNRLFWVEDIQQQPSYDFEDFEDKSEIKCINFWM